MRIIKGWAVCRKSSSYHVIKNTAKGGVQKSPYNKKEKKKNTEKEQKYLPFRVAWAVRFPENRKAVTPSDHTCTHYFCCGTVLLCYSLLEFY